MQCVEYDEVGMKILSKGRQVSEWGVPTLIRRWRQFWHPVLASTGNEFYDRGVDLIKRDLVRGGTDLAMPFHNKPC